MAVTDYDLQLYRKALGVGADASEEELTKAYMQKSYTLIRLNAPAQEREWLKLAHQTLIAQVGAAETRALAEMRHQGAERRQEAEVARIVIEAEQEVLKLNPELPWWHPASFDSWRLNLIAPLVVTLFAVLVQKSPLGFFLQGFHVWIHEFGHATVAWFVGRHALPLPLGWTSIGAEHSNFVYFGLLFLLVVLFVAGLRERKIVPMIAAVLLAFLQFWMTWRMSEDATQLWISFAGVGGEFYLSAAMMGLFFFRLPEKFRWAACRYVFLFLGAASFFQSYFFWRSIKRGEEGIPYGSMIHGEEDGGGDMNILRDDYHWTQHRIMDTYNGLGTTCLVVLLVVWAVFVLRIDKVVGRVLRPTEE